MIEGNELEWVEEMVYLDQILSFNNGRGREISTRIQHWGLKAIYKNKVNLELKTKTSVCSGTCGGSETSLNAVAHENIRVYYIYNIVCENFLEIPLNCVCNYCYLPRIGKNGSFQSVAKDHKKGTVCGNNGRPDSSQKKMNSRQILAGVLCRLQPECYTDCGKSIMQIAAPPNWCE